jgi:hypothetical protein
VGIIACGFSEYSPIVLSSALGLAFGFELRFRLRFDLGIGFAVICDYTGKEVVG